MKLIFATHNKHKVEEINQVLQSVVQVMSLDAIGCFDEIPETQATIEGNASQKSHFIYDKYHVDCFADDTGLEVFALDGAPGVYSARYAGEGCTFDDNIKKLLAAMQGIENREARFRTVISLILEGKEYQFEGVVEGTILTEERGVEGFGYDPVFLPKGYDKTFAEMPLSLKNTISHRGLAAEKLIVFLKTHL